MLAGVIIVAALIYFRGFNGAFALWNLPPLKVPFLDLQFFASSAESYRHGFDPVVSNPFDPLGRIFNYPPIWNLVLLSGMNDSWTIPVALAMFAAFLVAVAAFPGKLSGLSSALILLALLSPAAMQGFSSANVEFIIFILMSLAFLLSENLAWAAFAVIAFAILLKLTPVLGVGGLITRKRSVSLRLIVGSLLFTVLFFVFSLNYMQFLWVTHLRGTYDAYGAVALPALLEQIAGNHGIGQRPVLFYTLVSGLDLLLTRFPVITRLASVLVFILSALLGLRFRMSTGDSNPRNLRAFWMGAGIYVGTFLIAANWDYRMIFLIFVLPQAADWVTGQDRRTRAAAVVSLVALFVSMWYGLIDLFMGRLLSIGLALAGLLTSSANWTLVAALTYLAVASLPAWLYEDPRALLRDLLARGHASGAADPPLLS